MSSIFRGIRSFHFGRRTPQSVGSRAGSSGRRIDHPEAPHRSHLAGSVAGLLCRASSRRRPPWREELLALRMKRFQWRRPATSRPTQTSPVAPAPPSAGNCVLQIPLPPALSLSLSIRRLIFRRTRSAGGLKTRSPAVASSWATAARRVQSKHNELDARSIGARRRRRANERCARFVRRRCLDRCGTAPKSGPSSAPRQLKAGHAPHGIVPRERNRLTDGKSVDGLARQNKK